MERQVCMLAWAGGATVSTVIPNLGCKANMTAVSGFDSRIFPQSKTSFQRGFR